MLRARVRRLYRMLLNSYTLTSGMRVHNFYAGPATLPRRVLEDAASELVDYQGYGLSIMETSHRSKEYEQVHNQAIERLKTMLSLDDEFEVVLLGGGATLQFGMVPMNLLTTDSTCEIVVSGSWAKKAKADAETIGGVSVAWDGSEQGFTTLPDATSIKAKPGSAYMHITSNETIQGVQWQEFPDTGRTPLVCDMSSDILSRPLPLDRFDLIYAGAQKNLGPAGVTVVIIRRTLLERMNANLPAYLSYRTHVEKNSLYNTPPVYPIYMLNKVLGWVEESGGVAAMESSAAEKSQMLYQQIDNSDGFYHCPISRPHRSRMNVVFRLRDESLETQFIEEAADEGMVGLKGHRSVGGVRASLYNSLPIQAVEDLTAFMHRFAAEHR